MGDGFIIESTTNRSVDVNEIKLKSLSIVSAVTVIDLEEETIMLELHGCILINNKQITLLSTFQAREAGVIVHDIAKKYNSK